MSPVLSPDVSASVELLESLAVVASEYESSLDLARFVNLVDLYAHHVEAAERGEDGRALPFEAFVADAERLAEAARAASRTSGRPVPSPAPLGGTVDA